MSCHIVMNAGDEAFCGRNKFGKEGGLQEGNFYHTYVEVMAGSTYGGHIGMSDCKECQIEYHKQEIERLEE